MNQKYSALIHGLIEAFKFLESCGADEVNPDSAVGCMENISSHLLALDRADQLALRSDIQETAGDSQDPVDKKFIQDLPNMIGLASSGK